MQDNFSSLDPYLQDYTAKSQKAAGAASYATTLPDLLTKTLNEKLSGSPIIEERSGAASNFLRELGAAPATVSPQNMGGVVLNPNEQAAIISGRRATALTPLMTANQRYDLLSGQIPDIVGAAGRSAQAQATLAQGEAGIAGETYKTLLDRMIQEEQFSLERQKLAQSGGGGFDNSFSKLLDAILNPPGGGGGGQTREPEPNYSPVGGVGATSPGKDWVFNGQKWESAWEPIDGGDGNDRPPLSSFLQP